MTDNYFRRALPALVLTILVCGFPLCSIMPAMAADRVLYECKITKERPDSDWVSPVIGVVIDDGNSAEVIDGILIHFDQSPKPAKLRRRGDKLIVSWTLSGASDIAGQVIPQFSYKAQINMKTGAISVVANPVRFHENFRGWGTCEVRKD